MKTRLLTGLLMGLAFGVIGDEIKWQGTHRVLSSTQGHSTFNPRKSSTLCKLNVKEGKLTGMVTTFGIDARGTNWSIGEELSGTIQNHVIEWKSSNRSLSKITSRTVFHGVMEGATIVGYFEQTCYPEGKDQVTYGGLVDLKKVDGD